MRQAFAPFSSIRLGLLGLFVVLSTGPALADIKDLYVTSDFSNLVRLYTGSSGVFQSNFTSSYAASGQLGIHFGLTNHRVLVGHFSGGVEEFNATTGAYIKTYNASGGTQWAGLYGPNGNVIIGDWNTNDVREYDSATGALVQVLTSVTAPADMRIGPNGNLYICSYAAGFVMEVNATNGAFVSLWSQPPNAQSNDIAFNPNGEILVTSMITNVVYRYDSAHNLLGSFAGTGWGRPHGIEFSPWTGNVLVVDGVTGQVHEFNPTTYVELNPAFLVPTPGDKIVDLAFRPGETAFLSLCDPAVGGVISCPCSNPPSGTGRGCDNSSGTGGASLSASGGAYLGGDSLVFTTDGERPTATSIVLQGTTSPPAGIVYGQGVRCVGGTLKRLFVKAAAGGSITAPNFGAGDPTVSARSAAKGDVIQPGQSRYYLVYYRDPTVLGGCPASSTFNSTQTGRIDWSL